MSYRYRYPALSPNGQYVASGARDLDVVGERRGTGWGPVWLDDDRVIVNGGDRTRIVYRDGREDEPINPDGSDGRLIAYQELSADAGLWVGCTPGIRLRHEDGVVVTGRYFAPCLRAGRLAVLFDQTVDERKPLTELLIDGDAIAVGRITQPSLSKTHVVWRQGFGAGWRTMIANLDGSGVQDISLTVEHWSVLVETPAGDLVLSHDGARTYLRRPGETRGWLVVTGDCFEPRARWTPNGIRIVWMAGGALREDTILLTDPTVDLSPISAPAPIVAIGRPLWVGCFFGRESRYGVDPQAPGDCQVVVDSGVKTTGPVIIARVSDQGADLITAYRNDWSRVVAIYVAEEAAPVSQAKTEAAIESARMKMRALGLPRRTVLTYTGDRIWPGLSSEWHGFQCYPNVGESVASAERRWRDGLSAFAGKTVVIIGGAYDRNKTIDAATLAACQPRLIEIARDRKGLLYFSWRRPGGASEYPTVAAWIRAAAAAATPPAIETIAPLPPSPVPTPLPTPQPEDPEMPRMTFDESLAVMNEAAEKWRSMHIPPDANHRHLLLDQGQAHLWLWRMLVEGYDRERLLASVT